MVDLIKPRQIEVPGDPTKFLNGEGEFVTPAAGGGSGYNPNPVEDPTVFAAKFGAASAFDYEFGASSSSLPTGFSWVNQGSATYQEDFGAGVLSHPGPVGATDDVKAVVQSLSGTPATWTVTARCETSAVDANFVKGGLILRDSASGKLITFGWRTGRTVAADKWTNPTTYSAGLLTAEVALPTPRFFRIAKTGATTWDFYFSVDGVAWRKLGATQNITTFMTPDQVGFGGLKNGATPAAFSCHWFRLR